MKKRGFIVGDYLAWWILAIFALFLGLIIAALVTGKGTDAIEALKNMLGIK